MKYVCALLTVGDMAKSKDFYARLLGRSVTADFGANVAFGDGFSLHLRDHFRGLVGREVRRGENDVELYFEEEDLSALESRLRSAGIEFIHGAVEQPWRQIAMRFLDLRRLRRRSRGTPRTYRRAPRGRRLVSRRDLEGHGPERRFRPICRCRRSLT